MPLWKALEERFWSKVDKNGPIRRIPLNNCWQWTDYINKLGRGQIGDDYRATGKVRMLSPSKLSYTMAFGEIPKGLVVRHLCGNSMCVRPEHLMIGTQKDNIRDSIDHGTKYTPESLGTLNGRCKLSESDVLEIRNAYSSNELQKDIAKRYGINQVTVSCIVTRKTWKHI